MLGQHLEDVAESKVKAWCKLATAAGYGYISARWRDGKCVVVDGDTGRVIASAGLWQDVAAALFPNG